MSGKGKGGPLADEADDAEGDGLPRVPTDIPLPFTAVRFVECKCAWCEVSIQAGRTGALENCTGCRRVCFICAERGADKICLHCFDHDRCTPIQRRRVR